MALRSLLLLTCVCDAAGNPVGSAVELSQNLLASPSNDTAPGQPPPELPPAGGGLWCLLSSLPASIPRPALPYLKLLTLGMSLPSPPPCDRRGPRLPTPPLQATLRLALCSPHTQESPSPRPRSRLRSTCRDTPPRHAPPHGWIRDSTPGRPPPRRPGCKELSGRPPIAGAGLGAGGGRLRVRGSHHPPEPASSARPQPTTSGKSGAGSGGRPGGDEGASQQPLRRGRRLSPRIPCTSGSTLVALHEAQSRGRRENRTPQERRRKSRPRTMRPHENGSQLSLAGCAVPAVAATARPSG